MCEIATAPASTVSHWRVVVLAPVRLYRDNCYNLTQSAAKPTPNRASVSLKALRDTHSCRSALCPGTGKLHARQAPSLHLQP